MPHKYSLSAYAHAMLHVIWKTEMNNLHIPQRLAGESFDDYKARRKASKEAGRMVRLVHDTKNQGTYVNLQKQLRRLEARRPEIF